jgi:TniQ
VVLRASSASQFPVVPRRYPDESISSWTERLACFYGVDFDHLLAGLLIEMPQRSRDDGSIDLDSDKRTRAHLIRWTGACASLVPTTIDSRRQKILPPRSRLAFCPHCWDDDIAHSRQPFLRKSWAYWSTVHCATHRVFLKAKLVHPDRRQEFVTWRRVWASKDLWRCAFDLSAHDSCEESPYTVDDKNLSRRLMSSLRKFENGGNLLRTTALGNALSPRSVGKVERMIRSFSGSAHVLGISETALNTCAFPWPLLLERRIAVLLLAVESLGDA